MAESRTVNGSERHAEAPVKDQKRRQLTSRRSTQARAHGDGIFSACSACSR
jgi:hypothetical protein